ncbi:aminotransferase class I/II-fold pyridoxal phosphate-dependent enzyme [Proteus vulgaris]|jgi:histidinol-phosphate aminotransferase|uniref:Aminotransferase n=1 Tax=Proteus vulgaris TaxID=585 RepID=A0A379FDW1_PROVU|nr:MULTISPECIES: aminotransferase class I/II-fold pyridoxal phosphate-dependent enzyme [Proteus]NBN60654.1 aminotransferase class I/II-fold pyridoxal phosphate-dependent enzyme [Proteus sp. G2639]RNT28931.1 aminotransferase class I/II-fold pyridoxal phosphate-dependent enzyme [Proteus mirabilis]AYY80833.1 aminotransferase class I/II-fold pyridoxal phosphate-dependent enzyme [Proteus vulgaris]MBG5969481.1 aminotransferase class I/II-fold pyridoxal phosphate-dependent enzyme [Proteus vulgaris]MB
MNRRSFLTSSSLVISGLSLSPFVSSVYANETLKNKLVFNAENPLLLNFNENSLGMSQKAKQAIINALPNAFRYPDDARSKLINELGKEFKLSDKHISLGNGSSETIQAAVQYVANKAQKEGKAIQLIVPDPTFNYAELYAEPLGVKIVKIPVDKTLAFDLETMQKKAQEFDGISMVYLCNPNNPTAMLTPTAALTHWIKSAKENVFFIIDEAYAEFVSTPEFTSAITLVEAGYKNLIVARTFSKIYALAGLRVGYGVAVPDVVADVDVFVSIDNTNTAGAVAALASLKDKAYVEYSRKSIDVSRQMVVDVLKELDIEYAPSHANFIFHKVKGDVKTYQNRMKDANIMVGREFPPALGWSRLTLGTPEEMRYFVTTLKAFRTKGWI